MSAGLARWLDGAALLALSAAVGVLAWPGSPGAARVALPLLASEDPAGSLHAPGGDERLIATRAAALGEVLTIEDLVRTTQAAIEGRPGLPPLSEAERAELARLLDRAVADRDALLAVEAELAAARDRLDGAGRSMAGELDPTQQGYILQERDRISVQGVEVPYWQQTREGLQPEGTQPAGTPP